MPFGRDRSIDENDGDDVPVPQDEVRKLFWAIVILLNAGILAVSLGLMLAGFRGQYGTGAVLVGVGGVVLADAYRRYRSRHEVFEATA